MLTLPHIRALDGARGIAVGLVLAYHFGVPGFPGGFLGVDLFFVLSGFLITTLLVTEARATGRIDFVQFWYRRARRLLPALFLLLGVIAIWALSIDPVEKGILRWDLLASIGYVVNWRFIFTGQSYFADFVGASPVRPLWSLAIEEQFYLAWPIIVAVATIIVARWRGLGSRAVLAVLVISLVGSIVLMAVTFDAADPSTAYYSTFARAHELLIGAIAALVAASDHPIRWFVARHAAVLAVVGLAAVIGCALLVGDTASIYYLGGSAVFSVAAAILVMSLVVGSETRGPVHRVLGFGPLVWLGAISYGVYLWHWPLVVWLTPQTIGLDGLALLLLRLAWAPPSREHHDEDSSRSLSTDDLRVLAAWAPTLAAPGMDFGQWVKDETDADGVIHMGWYEYSPNALRFMADVSRAGFVQPFDWMAWAGTPAVQALIADPTRVGKVDAEDLRRLLTAIIRGDRFMEGNAAAAFESGMLVAIARRASTLVEENRE